MNTGTGIATPGYLFISTTYASINHWVCTCMLSKGISLVWESVAIIAQTKKAIGLLAAAFLLSLFFCYKGEIELKVFHLLYKSLLYLSDGHSLIPEGKYFQWTWQLPIVKDFSPAVSLCSCESGKRLHYCLCLSICFNAVDLCCQPCFSH